MTLPGTVVSLLDVPPPASAPSDTTTWFVTGTSDRGPLAPVLVRSMAEFVTNFGQRQSYSILYDALDVYFREGGSSAYVSRVVGPAPTFGFKNLNDAGAAVSLIVTALGPGAYSTGVFVGVVAGVGGGTYHIQITDGVNILEESPDLTTQLDAVNWSQQSQYVRITLGASSNVPAVVAPAALSAGNDDRANATDATWLAALDRFSTDLGPGQVSHPGRTSDTAHTQLLAHAQSHRRVAILDGPDTATVSTLTTSVTNARVGNQRYGALFAPWLVVPGVVSNTVRTAPPCSLISGVIARNEAQYGPDAPAAGFRAIARFVTGLSQPAWSDPNRETLNNGSVNVILSKFGSIMPYGWRSLVSYVVDPAWVDFGNSRLYMAIASDADEIAQGYVFDVIDGQGQTIAQFGGDLSAMLQRYYTSGQLYGLSADQAFNVDVGAQVNTPQTIANNELHAVLSVRMSPMAEVVAIQISKVPITQAVQ